MSDSNDSTWLAVILSALAIGGFAWAFSEKQKKERALQALTNRNVQYKQLNNDYMVLLQEFISKQKDLPSEIEQQLLHLRETYSSIDDAVATELTTVMELIKMRKGEIAIEKLAKVIENVLSNKFELEGLQAERKKCKSLFDMLEMAKKMNWIGKKEFHFSMFLKEERNEEAHELAVKFGKNWEIASFLGGIEILYKFKGSKK